MSEHDNAIDEQAIQWLVILQDQPVGVATRQAFDAWLASSERHRRAWNGLQAMWQGMDELRPVAAPPQPRRRPHLAVAASLLLTLGLLGGLWSIQPAGFARTLLADYRTATGAPAEYRLEDGSLARLGAHSALSVDFHGSQRRVSLHQGEALFEVRADPSRPFVVSTTDGEVTVLGTRFNVKQGPSGTQVEVVSGHVAVRAGDGGASRELRAGQAVRYSRTRMGDPFELPVADIALWRQQLLRFQGAPLGDVLEDLNRYRPGRILVDADVAHLPVTGIFDTRTPDKALDTILTTLPLRKVSLGPRLVLVRPR